MKEILLKILDSLGLAYWLEIVTEHPHCIYYFGPFIQAREATSARDGYVEDLQLEGARKITVQLKRLRTNYKNLTIFDTSLST